MHFPEVPKHQSFKEDINWMIQTMASLEDDEDEYFFFSFESLIVFIL
jgi:hypothetical protein